MTANVFHSPLVPEEGILGGCSCTLFQGINRIEVRVQRDEERICGNKGQPEGFSLNYINSCLQFVSGFGNYFKTKIWKDLAWCGLVEG